MCAVDRDCAGDLVCCTIGRSGGCGRGRGSVSGDPDDPQRPPCVPTRRCTTGPCVRLSLPPYGGSFIDETIV
jgi:hypothetical protein